MTVQKPTETTQSPYATERRSLSPLRAVRGVLALFGTAARQTLHIELWRATIAIVRYLVYARLLRSARTYFPVEQVSDALATNGLRSTLQHNLRVFKIFRRGFISEVIPHFAVDRSDYLIRPVTALDRVRRRIGKLNVLTVGPRTEGEILNLVAHGFRRHNIKAVDIISYSPWVDLADMHDMPYPDRSFDVIFCGWVLNYTTMKSRAVGEILRVAREGCIVAFGATYTHSTADAVRRWGDDSILSPQDYIDLLGDRLDRIYFTQDPRAEGRGGQVILVARIKHPAAAALT